MPTILLTDAKVEALTPAAVRYDVRDAKVSGLELRVGVSGAKTYSYQYRMPGARKKERVRIGNADAINLKTARQTALQLAAQIARGENPRDARRRRRDLEGTRVAALGDDVLASAAAHVSLKTARDQRAWWTRYVVPKLGRLEAATITKGQVRALHDAIAKDAPATAAKVLSLLHSFFTWCEEHERVTTNPARGIKRKPQPSAGRALQGDEFARLWAALETAATTGLEPAPADRGPTGRTHTPEPADPIAVAALKFLLFSGWRTGEVLQLRRDAVDLEARRAVLTTHKTAKKTGASVRYLAPEAIAVLRSVPRLVGSPFFFPSPKAPGQPRRDLVRLWRAVRHAAGLDTLRKHDLRHALVSVAVDMGEAPAVLGPNIGQHDLGTTLGTYHHRAAEAAKATAARVGAELARLVGAPPAPPVAVVPIATAQRRRVATR
jgi:integrase